MKNNRNTKGAAEGSPSILLHFVVVAVVAIVAAALAAVVAAVVAAVGFASLSALAGTASSGLSRRRSTSAPGVRAKADAAAGPLAAADADLDPLFSLRKRTILDPLSCMIVFFSVARTVGL